MTKRIPFDSPLWSPATSDMEDPLPFLKSIQGSDPTVDQIYDVLDVLYETDDPSDQFFYAIPYILDVFEKDVEAMLGPLKAFCRQVRGLDHLPEENEKRKQLDYCKNRILTIICGALPYAKQGPDGYDHVAVLLSGIANLLGHTHLAHQVSELRSEVD